MILKIGRPNRFFIYNQMSLIFLFLSCQPIYISRISIFRTYTIIKPVT